MLSALLRKVTPNDLHSKKVINRIKDSIKNKKYSELLETLKSETKVLPDGHIRIAVTGRSGVGKSSLINALLGLEPNTPGAAAVGPVETTFKVQEFQFPRNENIKLVDLPGVGTPEFPKETYIEKVNLTECNALVIISERLSDHDVWLLKVAKDNHIPTFFVRSKVGSIIDNQCKADRHTSREIVTAKVLKSMKTQSICADYEVETMYLIDSYETDKYDFKRLVRDIADCNDKIRLTLVQSLNVQSKILIDLKKECLHNSCWFFALGIFFPKLKVEKFSEQFDDFAELFCLNERKVSGIYCDASKVQQATTELREIMTSDLKIEEIKNRFLFMKYFGTKDWCRTCVDLLAEICYKNLDNLKTPDSS